NSRGGAACTKLAARAFDILPGRSPDLREHAAAVQGAGHFSRALGARAAEAEALHGVVGDEVDDAVLAAHQRGEALDLLVAVVHALDQGPLVLDRPGRPPRVTLGELDELLGRD